MTWTTRFRALLTPALLVGLTPSLGRASEDRYVEAIQAQREVPESELLDVGIRIFDPGLPEDEEERNGLEEEGVYPDVRKSEARFIPMVLKRTLESTGYWGAVRLVPLSNVVDLTISGTILESTGKDLEVEILAVDSRGDVWLMEKFEQEANPIAYAETETDREPYQSLYNRIANELLEERSDLDAEDFVEIRRVSRLKFASDLAPAAFEDHLAVRGGRYQVARLPAANDPMMERVGRIRDRDHMFIDTLNEHYAEFYAQMEEPYDSWRSFSYEEQVALEKLSRASKWEKILGAAAIFGGIMAQRSRSRGGRAAGEAAILGGMAAINDGMQKSEEAKMHREALRELAQSLDSDIEPMLMEVEGEVLRLTGSVDTQYETWRKLLRQIFATETGFGLDPNEDATAAGNKSPSQ